MRTPPEELHADAVEALLDALGHAGLRASRAGTADIEVQGPSGPLLIEVKAAAVVGVEKARTELEAHPRAHAAPGQQPQGMVVLVADQLSEEARALLRETEWGYLDRRGVLWLRRPDLIVNDTSLPPLGRHRARPDAPIRGRVALSVALRRLMRPDAEESIRQVAGAVGASPSTVHDALTSLREHALIDAHLVPLVPDLFEAVAAAWRPERIPVRRPPQPGDADLELGPRDHAADDDAAHRWVVSGDVGAAASGARIVVASGAPPDFYVPNQTALRRAIRRLGQCSYDERGATVALAPSPLVTAQGLDAGSHATPWIEWPIAHPVVIALDLAQDLARGREIIHEWTPQGFHRVW